MTITFPHQSSDHHIRVAAIAVTFVVVLAATGLTLWQGASVGGGSSNASVETAEAEPFSPEKARINTTPAATQSRAVTTPAAEQRQALESSLPSGARAATVGTTTRGAGHPDFLTPTERAGNGQADFLTPTERAGNGQADFLTPTERAGSVGTSVTASQQATAASLFAAIDASDELKEYALAQSITDSVVDYEKAGQLLRDFSRWDYSKRSVNQTAATVETQGTQGTALDELPSNCTYWGICTPE